MNLPAGSEFVYKPAKAYAAEVRAAVKAAQKSGLLDPTWKIRVRTELSHMCAEVGVSIENVTDDFLFVPAPADDQYHWDRRVVRPGHRACRAGAGAHGSDRGRLARRADALRVPVLPQWPHGPRLPGSLGPNPPGGCFAGQ